MDKADTNINMYICVCLFSLNSYSMLSTAMCETGNDSEGRPSGMGERIWILEKKTESGFKFQPIWFYDLG